MSVGLCLGSIGIGACKDATRDTSKSTIVNTAMAYALDQCIFNCKTTVEAGNKVHAASMCSCAQLGIAPGSAACSTYQQNVFNFQSQCTTNLQSNPPKSTAQLQSLICACRSTSGCNIGVTQDSSTSSQQTCSNNAEVTNNINNDFSNNVIDSLKSTMSDIGGVFDSNNHEVVKNLTNTISQNITTQHISQIESAVNAAQSVSAGCGGINFGVTQVSRYTNILNVLNTTKDFNTLSNKIEDTLKTDITRTNNGLTGWLYGNYTTVLIVCAVILIGVVAFFWFKKQSASADAQVAMSASPDNAASYFGSRATSKEFQLGSYRTVKTKGLQSRPQAVAAVQSNSEQLTAGNPEI